MFKRIKTHHLILSIVLITAQWNLKIAGAAESDIAKFPTYIQASTGGGVLAPPIVILGINNASPVKKSIIKHTNLNENTWGEWAWQDRITSKGFWQDAYSGVGSVWGHFSAPTGYYDFKNSGASAFGVPADGYAHKAIGAIEAGGGRITFNGAISKPDLIQGGNFIKNIFTAYDPPENMDHAGNPIYNCGGACASAPFFYGRAKLVSTTNASATKDINAIFVIESDSRIRVHFRVQASSGACSGTLPGLPIKWECWVAGVDTGGLYNQIPGTETSLIGWKYVNQAHFLSPGWYGSLANWWAYHRYYFFSEKADLLSKIDALPEQTTIYCKHFNYKFLRYQQYRGIWLGQEVWDNVDNPCGEDYRFSSVPAIQQYGMPLTYVADPAGKEVLKRYIALASYGNDKVGSQPASHDISTYLQRVQTNLQQKYDGNNSSGNGQGNIWFQNFYYGRKAAAPNTELDVNYCRRIYHYITNPDLTNQRVDPSSALNLGFSFTGAPETSVNPSGQSYGFAPTDFRTSVIKDQAIVEQVFNMWLYDAQPYNYAPNRLPKHFPVGTSFWSTDANAQGVYDPSTWQNIKSTASTYSVFNDISSYESSYLPNIIGRAGRLGASYFNQTIQAELGKALEPLNATGVNGQAASSALSGQILQEDGVIYRPFYGSEGWTGRLDAYALGSSGGTGARLWSSRDIGKIPAHNTRVVKTIQRSGTTANVVDFTFSNLSSEQQSQLLTSNILAQMAGAGNNAGNWLVDYLRGDRSREIVTDAQGSTTSGVLRARKDPAGITPMGDIMGSAPTLIQARDMGYSRLPGDEGAKYSAFLTAERSKTKLVAVGANDGMLHIFNAMTGNETFAFIPSSLIPKLGALGMANYSHEYYVDGGLALQHAYINNTWRALLIGSAGAGAKAVFAIDVTDRSNPKILFELSSAQLSDLGFQFGVPRVVRLNANVGGTSAGNWVMVHGNGFESSTGAAKLIVTTVPSTFVGQPTTVAIATPGVSVNNGLAPPAIWLEAGSAEVLYAGDKQGKLWRFNVSSSGTITAPTSAMLNAISPSGGQAQPFTTKPDLALHPQGGLVVYAGTGSIYRTDDINNKSIQSLYAVWDYPGQTGTVTRANLLKQAITADGDHRIVTSNAFNYSSNRGWYIDLTDASNAEKGERIVASPNVLFGRVMFNTYLPEIANGVTAGCGTIKEKSWFMSLDAFTGQAPKTAIFDLNSDDRITSADLIGGAAPAGRAIAPTASSVAMGFTHQKQQLATGTASANQSFAATSAGSCGAAHRYVSKNSSSGICVPRDSCGKGFIWVKAGQNSSEDASSLCVNANQQKPRLSWKQIQ